MRVSHKLVFHQSKCISAIKRILSTTATYISSSSLCIMYSLLLRCMLKVQCLRVGVKTFRNTIYHIIIKKKETALGLPQLSVRFLSDSNSWNAHVTPNLQNYEADAQEYWDNWLLTMFLQTLSYFFSRINVLRNHGWSTTQDLLFCWFCILRKTLETCISLYMKSHPTPRLDMNKKRI